MHAKLVAILITERGAQASAKHTTSKSKKQKQDRTKKKEGWEGRRKEKRRDDEPIVFRDCSIYQTMTHPSEIGLRTTRTNTMMHYIFCSPRHMSTMHLYLVKQKNAEYAISPFFPLFQEVSQEYAKTLKRTG